MPFEEPEIKPVGKKSTGTHTVLFSHFLKLFLNKGIDLLPSSRPMLLNTQNVQQDEG